MTEPTDNAPDTDPQMRGLLDALETPDHSSDFWTTFDANIERADNDTRKAEADATVTQLRLGGSEAEMGWRAPSPATAESSLLRQWGMPVLSAAAAVLMVVVGFNVFASGSTPVDSTVVLSELPEATEKPAVSDDVVFAAEPTVTESSVAVEPTAEPAPAADEEAAPATPTAPTERPTSTPEPTAVPAIVGSPAAATEPPTGLFSCTTAVGTEDHLNVRSAPTLGAPVLDEIPGGSCAIWLLEDGVGEESVDGGWAHVRYGTNAERSGWVSAKFLVEVQDPNLAIVDIHGVHGVAWGTPWLVAEEALVAALGTPDAIGDWVPLCSAGTGESERVLRWSNLAVRFRGVENPQLVAARIEGSGPFAAVNGLSTGLTFTEVREFFPAAATFVPEPGERLVDETGDQWMWRSEAAYRAYRPTFSGAFPGPNETPTAASIIDEVAIGPWIPGCERQVEG